MRIEITKDKELNPDLLLDMIKESYSKNIADKILENIINNINSEEFETIRGIGTVTGIVDFGKYKTSFIAHSESPDVFIVGSNDPKAKGIENGTMGSEHANLKDSEIIKWYKRNGIKNAVREGKALAAYIRAYGTPPKPAVGNAINQTRTEQHEILIKTVATIKKRLTKMLK